MPRGATQDGRVMVEQSDRMWSMRKGMANHFSILALRTPWTVWKGNMIGYRKSLTCSTWMQSQKWKNDLCSFPRQTIQYHGNPSLCPNQKFLRSLSWMVVWRPTRPLKTKKKNEKKKDILFIIGDWNAKVGSQETLGVTGKFGLGILNEAGQRLIEFCQEHTLAIANILFQQHKRRWSIPKSV